MLLLETIKAIVLSKCDEKPITILKRFCTVSNGACVESTCLVANKNLSRSHEPKLTKYNEPKKKVDHAAMDEEAKT